MWRRSTETMGVGAVVLLFVIVLTILEPEYFFTGENLSNVGRQSAVLALLAAGQFVAIVTAGIDLSVGAVMALSMVVLARLAANGAPNAFVLIAPVAVGAVCGLSNGIGLVKLRLPHPFVMTLATMYVFRGAANLISGGVPVSGLSDPVRALGAGNLRIGTGGWGFDLPTSIIVVLAVFTAMWVLLRFAVLGRHFYALGGNESAAFKAGVAVGRVRILAYVISGTLAGFAGLLLAGRTNSGYPNAGIGIELDAIAAVIIGGASFFGGRGTIWAALGGVVIMGLLRNGLNLQEVSVFWQQVLVGTIILAAVSLDGLRSRMADVSRT